MTTTTLELAVLRVGTTLRDYVSLLRPRILALVLLTAPPAMAFGRPWPDTATLCLVVLATALLAGGCSVLNAWYERDRDALMARTRDRALPSMRVPPGNALVFGLLISVLGLLLLFLVGGALPAALGLAALLHYVLVYTVWLKPRTPAAVIVGGATGAVAPVLAGAAVDGFVGFWPLVLFAIVFVWQPPHFWAIALYRRDEYAQAGFPMLPERIGARRTRLRMLGWALALIPVTLVPWLLGPLGTAYGATALAGGTFFVARIVRAMQLDSDAADRRVFTASLSYLTALFAVMLIELAWS